MCNGTENEDYISIAALDDLPSTVKQIGFEDVDTYHYVQIHKY